MKTSFTIHNARYQGLCFSCDKGQVGISPATKYVTTGFLFSKKTTDSLVYVVSTPREVHCNTGASVEIDYYWTIREVFDTLPEAEEYRDNYIKCNNLNKDK